jgi:hypothetical protein
MKLRHPILALWIAASIISIGWEIIHSTAGCTHLDGQIWCRPPPDTDPDLSGDLGSTLVMSIIFGLLPPTIVAAAIAIIWAFIKAARHWLFSN